MKKRFVYFSNTEDGRVKIFEAVAETIQQADGQFREHTGKSAGDAGFSVCPLDLDSPLYPEPAIYIGSVRMPRDVRKPPGKKPARPAWCSFNLSADEAVAMMPPRMRVLIERDGLNCCWCNRATDPRHPPHSPLYPTREHLTRRADGGKSELSNLKVACHHCNTTRHKPGWKPPQTTT